MHGLFTIYFANPYLMPVFEYFLLVTSTTVLQKVISTGTLPPFSHYGKLPSHNPCVFH